MKKILIFGLLILSFSCKKNTTTVTKTVVDITPRLSVSLNGEMTEHTPYAIGCNTDSTQVIAISNTQALLDTFLDINEIMPGDFRLDVLIFDDFPVYNLLYISDTLLAGGGIYFSTFTQNTVDIIYDDDYITGEVSGTIVSFNGLDTSDFKMTLSGLIEVDQSFCN